MAGIRVGAVRVGFDRIGSGAPLLLYHPAFLSRIVWERNLAALAARFDVIAVDLPGHGESEAPEDWVPDLVGFTRDLLDALGLERVLAMGASFGGGVLVRAAADFPERFERLVLVAPTGVPKEEIDRYRGRASGAKDAWSAFREFFEDREVATRERFELFRRLQSKAAPFFRRYRANHPPGYEKTGWVPWMNRVRCPVLLVWGSDDPVIPRPADRRTREEIPGSVLWVMQGARHFPFLCRPDEFHRGVIPFLEHGRWPEVDSCV